MADYSKLTKRELIMTLYARDLMLENERKRLEHLTEKYFELKQQLHDLPKKIVEEIRDITGDYWEECENNSNLITITNEDFDETLDTILKKYGDNNESIISV